MKMLVVVDMQNDFIDDALGNDNAAAIVPKVAAKIRDYCDENPDVPVLVTMDTHDDETYMDSNEGKHLPILHCVSGRRGWNLNADVKAALDCGRTYYFYKMKFASIDLAKHLADLKLTQEDTVEVVGLCTDICVVSNALLIKAYCPEANIVVDSACCAGSTPARHEAALETMRSCQIDVV